MDSGNLVGILNSEKAKGVLGQKVLRIVRVRTPYTLLLSRLYECMFEIYSEEGKLLGYIQESPRVGFMARFCKAERSLDFTVKSADGTSLFKITRPFGMANNKYIVSTIEGTEIGYCNQKYGLKKSSYDMYTLDESGASKLFSQVLASGTDWEFPIKNEDASVIGVIQRIYSTWTNYYIYGEQNYRLILRQDEVKKVGTLREDISSNFVPGDLTPEQMAVLFSSIVAYQFSSLITERTG